MNDFFIRRPIVAMVISILTVLLGVVMMLRLPVAEFPEVSPSTVVVNATFRGADAETVEKSVAVPIESQVNGVSDMLYMKSVNGSDGKLALTVTFDLGTDGDINQVNTQNRVALAQARLPEAVAREGLQVRKASPDILMVIGLFSPKESYDAVFLSNYAQINLVDALARVPGIGEVRNFTAQDYAMRVWLRPDRMASLGITPADVSLAIREQSVQAPAGLVGAEPAPPGQEFQYNVRAGGLLETPEEFADIVVRSNVDGSQVKIRDIATVGLGAQAYSTLARVNGAPGAALGLYLAPGANAIDAATRVRALLDEAAGRYLPDMAHRVIIDATLPITASIREIVSSLFAALILVVLVTWLFLQSWRATLIPALAIPVALLGTFMVFPLFGFTLNTLSMFGLVLAIGIVVDNAIVVVEGVQSHIDKGLSPRDATVKTMKEVTGPIVAMTAVMVAVFGPVAFMGGLTGRLYQQFAVTIAIAVVFSGINALTLSPALAAMLLRKAAPGRGPIGGFFRVFNRGFEASASGYTRMLGGFVRRAGRSMLILVALFAGTGMMTRFVPAGFVPDEDKGYFFVSGELPAGASLQRMDAAFRKAEAAIASIPGVQDYCTVGGVNMMTGAAAANAGTIFIGLKDWADRRTAAEHVRGIIAQAFRKFAALPEARLLAFGPPALPGYGSASGFTFELQDRSGGSVEQLAGQTRKFLAEASKRPELTRLYTGFRVTDPQVKVDVDRDKCRALGVKETDVLGTMQAFLGGQYVNDFVRFGRTFRVFLQAAPEYTATPESIGRFYARSTTTNTMVPLDTLVSIGRMTGPSFTMRYNLYRAAEITGAPAPGYSSGQAMAAMEEVARATLPRDYGFEWTGLAYQERKVGNEAVVVFGMAILIVFLLLAALYESWSLPFAVLLPAPLVMTGVFAGLMTKGFDNNVFAQVGLMMLVGLAAKTFILIVEFAKQLRGEGRSLTDAALEACRSRFRAIMMTVWSSVLGVVPMAMASGSGAVSRQVVAYSAIFGLTIAIVLGLLLVPVCFVFVQRIAEWGRPAAPPDAATVPEGGPQA